MKKQKGITLIALIITIIVMLILVGVTISVSLNGGLFSTANEATTQMDMAQEKEQLLMAAMGSLKEDGKVDFNKLDSNLPEGFTKTGKGTYKSEAGNIFKVNENGSITLVDETQIAEIWKQTGTIVTNTQTGQTISVGDYVLYNSGVNDVNDEDDPLYGWRVLGAENGQILLISADIVGTQVLNGATGGYNTGINTLDNVVCAPYGEGEYATGARSVKVEDINRVTGYNPESTNDDGGRIMAGTIMEYGKEITYTKTDTGIAYTDGESISGETSGYRICTS